MLTLTLLVHLASVAWADGGSADVELFQPRFGDGPVPGVDSPWLRKRTLRIGLYGFYEANPLVEYRSDGTEKPVIGMRIGGALGGSYDLTDRFSLRAGLPVSFQSGGETEGAADGVGLGDATFGGRAVLVRTKPFQLGLHADVTFPVGTRNSWRGERDPRLFAGALVGVKGGPVAASLDLGVVARNAVETSESFTLGSEGFANVGVAVEAVPKLLSLGVGVWTRAGFANFFQGGAENSAEFLVNGKITPSKSVQIDVAAGRGLTEGYGTSDVRVIAGVTYKRRFEDDPKPVVEELPKQDPNTYLKEVSDDELEKAIQKDREEEKKKAEEELEIKGYAWKDQELARINGANIEVRDPIKFAVASDGVLPESVPTLEYVSKLIGPNDMLIIEGHASDEGEFKYNYELSLKRARAVWEELLRAGVGPSHLSYRGMGEVVPAAAGQDEASLAQSRRVVFYLVRLTAPPGGTDMRKLPWDGNPQPAAPTPLPAVNETPTPPPAPKPAEEEE